MKEKVRIPVFAGMKFTYPGTTDNKLREVGHYFVTNYYSGDGQLIKSTKSKTVFN